METRAQETWIATRLPFPQPTEEKMDAAVFIDAGTGQLRHLDLIPASADQLQFSQCLWRAIEAPSTHQEPYRPGTLVVDHEELERATRPLTRMQRIALHHDPSIKQMIQGPLTDMLAGMVDMGFCYTYDEDVAPTLVGKFFERVHSYLEAAPWNKLDSTDVVVLEGLETSPLYCIVMGAGGKLGLSLCLNRQALEAVFAPHPTSTAPHASLTFTLETEPGPGLSEEIASYKWRVHPLGVPTLIRCDRMDRPHPTTRELRLANQALEAILLFHHSDGEEVEARLSTGRDVSMRVRKERLQDDRDRVLSVSLTPAQRKLMGLFFPYLDPVLELDKKRRRKVPVPLIEFERVEELVLTDSLRLLSSDKKAARGLLDSLVEAAAEAGLEYRGLNPIPDLNDQECQLYIERLLEGFACSPDFKSLPDFLPLIGTFYQLAYERRQAVPQQVGRDDVRAVLSGPFQERVFLKPEQAERFLYQLSEFFRYVRMEHRFHYANECLQSFGFEFSRSFPTSFSEPDAILPVPGKRRR